MKTILKIKIPKGMLIGIALITVLLVLAAAAKLLTSKEQEIIAYDYTVTEQKLADEVISYLNAHVEIPENVAAEIANVAVENYRIVLNSNVDAVSDNHTEAIEERVRTALSEYLPEDSALSETGRDGLAAGIAEIVWNTILEQIQTATEITDLETEYFFLAESIQGQIDKLEERKMKVSIQANIKSNQNIKDMSADELLSLINGMTDEELRELLRSLGLSYDEFYDLLASSGKEIDKDLDERLKKLREELEKELTKEIKLELEKEFSNTTSGTSTSGRDGKSGTNGKDGQNGKDGKDGEDGKAGKDGMSVFIMYSATSSGDNMTASPTDETKYMGTYTGISASSDPADYTWTRYSDATITYSDGTLYITQ